MKETLSHRQLESLIYVSNVLNSSLDIEKIIDSIMQVTISVIDAADGGVLFLFDEKKGSLVAESTTGFNPLIVNQLELKPGESMTGQSFIKKECLLFQSQNVVRKATSTLSPNNLKLMEASIPNYPFSTMCAPILLKDECIGVITIDAFNQGEFTEEDIKLVKAISHQAAVAIEKARLYREKETTVKQLEQLNNTITKQNHMLSRSVEIHNDLANLVLQGKEMNEILQYVYRRIDHDIFLFDDVGELLASVYNSPFTKEDVDKIRHLVLTPIQSTKSIRDIKSITLDKKDYELMIFPIGSKPELYGMLAVLTNEKMDDVDMTILEHACTVISLELVKKQAIFDAQQKSKGEFVEELLKGKMDQAILQQAKNLKLDPKNHYLVILASIDELDLEHVERKLSIKRHLVHIANRIFSSYSRVIAAKDDLIMIILSYSPFENESFHQHQLSYVIQQFLQEINERKWDIEVKMGVGRVKEGLHAISKSAQEAQKALKFMKSYSLSKRLIHYSELGVQRLLLQNTEEELIDYTTETLGDLLKYEADRKGELLQTLVFYFEHNQNVKETAESLHIHVNTLNYRLRRIKDILQVDFSETEEFLNLHLALQLYSYLKNKITL